MVERTFGKLLLYGIGFMIVLAFIPLLFLGIGALMGYTIFALLTLIAVACGYALYTEKPGRRLAMIDSMLGLVVPQRETVAVRKRIGSVIPKATPAPSSVVPTVEPVAETVTPDEAEPVVVQRNEEVMLVESAVPVAAPTSVAANDALAALRRRKREET